MGRIRGFLIRHRMSMLLRRVFRRHGTASHRRLDRTHTTGAKSLSKLINWTRQLRTNARAILTRNSHPGRGYNRVGHEPVSDKPLKGHAAVYVGENDGEFEKVLVPVVYLNHPLFENLLRESEKEYGFKYPGGITIPCPISDFETIRTRIHEVRCTHKGMIQWKRNSTDSRVTIL